jgi:hypothetical protein
MKVLEGTGNLPSVQGWRRWLEVDRLAAGWAIVRPARTRAMLLLGLCCASSAAAIELYPGPVAILFCLLMAAGCVASLRARAMASIVLAAVAAAALALGRLASEGPDSVLSGAAVRDPHIWAGIAAGSALLVGCTLLAVVTSRALAVPGAGAAGRRAGRGVEAPRAVLGMDAGLKRAEWELARAAHYRRQLTLCLVGLDDGAAGERQPSEPATSMRRVDRFLLHELSRFEVVTEHGATRRLLVLPEVWAEGFSEEAERLCRLAGRRAGRPVRVAMATFPFHGTRMEDLLKELELQISPPAPPQTDAAESLVEGSLPLAGRVGRGSDQAPESSQATGFAS